MLDAIRNLGGNAFLRNQLTLAFTGPRLALALLLVCGAMTAIHMIGYAVNADAGIMESGGMEGLLFAHSLGLLVLLIVLLPIKAAGSFEGPRMSGVFDQIVATGVDPRLFLLGAWVSGLIYAFVIMVATLPFAAGMLFFGAPLEAILANYALLAVYANVILAVTLAASTLVREWGAVPGTIFVLIACIMFGTIPDRDSLAVTPEFFAELTPARMLMIQAFPPGSIPYAGVDYGLDPVVLFWSIPRGVFRIGVWALVCGVALLVIAVGPGHRFRPGYDIFGTVTAGGGGRLGGLFKRLRGGLTRRIEVAFLYENAAGWTRRWGTAVRAGLVVLPVFVIWGLVLGSIYLGHPYPHNRSMWNDELYLSAVTITAAAPILWALVVCQGRSARLVPVQIGRWQVPREVFICSVFAVLAGCWFLLMAGTRDVLLDNLAAKARPAGNPLGLRFNLFDWARNRGGTPMTPDQLTQWESASWDLLLIVLALLVNSFLLSRAVSRLVPVLARFVTVALLFVLALAPLIMHVLISNQLISPAFSPIAYLSPGYVAGEILRDAPVSSVGRVTDFLAAHAALGTVLIATIFGGVLRARLRRPRQAAAAAAATLLLCAGVQAQDPRAPEDQPGPGPVVIEHVARGFDGSCFEQGVDFFTAVVRNPHDYPVRGEFWIEADRERIERRPLFLSAKSTRTLRVTQRPDHFYWGNRRGARLVIRVGDRRMESDRLDLIVKTPQRNRTGSGNDQHVFVGAKIDLPAPLLKTLWSNNALNGVSCPASDLPVEAVMYSGLEVIWMTATALGEMTPAQRRALRQYALFGGTVMFTGSLSSNEVAATDGWEDVLATTAAAESELDGKRLRHVKLVEGRDVLSWKDRALLNLRPVGAGHVGHFAFPPHREHTPAQLLDVQAFWSRFAEVVPASRFPHTTRNYRLSLYGDWSSMAYLGIYLGVYSIAVAAALFLAARRRRQSGVPLRWIAIPVLFCAAFPLLVGFVRSRPTTAGYVEYTWFGPGATLGATQGELRLRSAGKQHHRVAFGGSDVVALQAETYGSLTHGRTLASRPAGDADSPKSQVEFDMAGWSRARLLVGAPCTRLQPMQVAARQVDANTVLVEGTIPEDMRGVPAWAVWPDKRGYVSEPLPAGSSDFRVTLAQQTQKAKSGNRRQSWRAPASMPGHGVDFAQVSPTSALIVFAIETPRHAPGIEITSDDLDFEVVIPAYAQTWPQSPYTHLPRITRDGRELALQVRRAVIFEAPFGR